MPLADGTRVLILGGMKEFVGQVGTVTNREMDGRTCLHRVTLDKPVTIPNVGVVEDDLWSGAFLQELFDGDDGFEKEDDTADEDEDELEIE